MQYEIQGLEEINLKVLIITVEARYNIFLHWPSIRCEKSIQQSRVKIPKTR